MNIFRKEWQALRKSTFTWSLSLAAVALLLLALYPGFARDAEDFRGLLDAYPESVQKAFGLSLDSLTSFLGYYSFVLTYISLAGAIQAMNLGLGQLSKETREKTADFLLTKPVSRTRIITAKLFAALASLFVTNLIYLAAALLLAGQVASDVDYGTYTLLTLSVPLLQLLFFAFGLVLSVLLPKIRSVLPLSLGLVFGFYVLGMVASLVGEEAARYVTPFRYFDRSYIMAHSAYESGFVILELVLVVLFTAGTYQIYRKKDIHAV
ncbi:ABC transporter permease subunit [Gorillibacterium timonense]|uniref:ABC transporter permease subunit n=1 Tax=Gorillibacterium timonense TaxID=1689269 RepID=UPI00071C58C4|nr:ABC transporter permease subunit [Gorillibacterium timonense]